MIQTIRNWIFDMDGTLTVPVHDFDAIRIELDIPQSEDILDYLATLDPRDAANRHARLEEIEIELAHKGTAQDGVCELLAFLAERGDNLGILTRNNYLNTKLTLEAAELDRFFDPTAIFTRENAIPKPDPDAIFKLIQLWSANPNETAILGDYLHDLQAGRDASVHTIYFDSRKLSLWNDWADRYFTHWNQLLEQLKLL